MTISTLNYDREFDVIPRRRYTLIAEYLSNGQRTARWFYDTQTGNWYGADGWKRPNLGHRLGAEHVAYVEAALGWNATPEQLDLAERLVATARAIREPCGGRQCWLDLRADHPELSEEQARGIIDRVLRVQYPRTPN